MGHQFRFAWISLLLILSACVPAAAAVSPTPPENDVEVFGIGGRALVDVNNNGKIDDTDAPLPNARFTVRDGTGASLAMLTDEYGVAIGGPLHNAYPVTLHIEPPPGGKYRVIGPDTYTWSKVELVRNGIGAKFLFAPVAP